jgi:hypothetical protein
MPSVLACQGFFVTEYFDKSSLWNELKQQERKLYVKKKKSQDMGVFSKPSVRTGTKTCQSGIRMT